MYIDDISWLPYMKNSWRDHKYTENINNKVNLPIWMGQYLERSGINSVNPVVDITNYI